MEPYVVHVAGDLIQKSKSTETSTVFTSVQKCSLCKRILLNKRIEVDPYSSDMEEFRYWIPGHYVAEGASGKQWLSHTDDRIENPCIT